MISIGFIEIKTFQRRGYFFRNSAPRDSSLPLKMETERKNSRDRFSFSNKRKGTSPIWKRSKKFSTTNIFVDKTPVIRLFFFPLLFSNSLLLSNCRLKRCEKIWNFWKSAKDSRLSFLKFRIKHKTSTFIKRFLLSNLFPLRLIKINKQINNISFENWKIHEVKNF